MKIDSQQLRAAMVCQGKNDVRCYLNGVHIKGDKIESANGYSAVIMRLKNRVRGDWILKVRGKIPKSADISKFEFSKKESIVKHYDALGMLLSVHPVDVIDGNFPDISKIVDKEIIPAPYASFNAEYMSKINDMFGNKHGCHVALFTNTMGGLLKIKPIDARIKSLYGNPLFVLMPVRHDPSDVEE